MNKEKLFNRLLEIFPGALTWLVLTSPLWLSLRFPFFVAGLILFLNVYWFYKAIRIAIFSVVGYRKMQKAISTDWGARLESLGKNWEDFHHLLVIPTLKEPLEVLDSTLGAITKSCYPKDKIMVLLAFEEKEGKEKLKIKKENLETKYKDKFKKLFVTIHPKDFPGHHPGPGSNRTYAVQEILPKLDKMGIDFEKVILTTLDADFAIHPRFLAGLIYKYLTTNSPEHKAFTGVFWYYNNFWQAPVLNRIVASGVSFWQLSEMTGSNKYMNFSSHSINLKSLIEMDFWVVDKVNDDGEFFWRAYFHFGGDYKVIPHFLPIYADTVQHENLWESLKEQYLQLRRWAYGVEHMPYIVKTWWRRRDIPFFPKTDRLLFLIQGYLTWATLAVLITFGGAVLQLINPQFAKTVIGYNLPRFSSFILTLAFIGLFTLIVVHEKVAPKRPRDWGLGPRILSYLQWFLVPITILSFATFPALDAQTRLMFGKYMEFRVTRKFRTAKVPFVQ